MSQKSDTFQRILIARTDRIGDLVLTLPLAVELKKKYPDSHITFLVRLYTAEIARNCQSIDEVMIAPEVNGAIQSTALTNQIKAGGFNLAFLVFPDKSVSWACFRAGVSIRIGTAFRWNITCG
ncbi:MAG: hypothetical protein HYV28_16535 [Ignavibacteriales bacterium]|nr:hypothetical protein [Ignavibacteriales bacterium]